MRLSVILPVYSEEESVIHIVDRLEKLVGKKLYEIILIVSPKSNAKSIAICKDISKARNEVKFFFQKENPGLGRAVREGLQYVSGTHVLMMDSDGEMSPDTVPKLITKMEQTGCDMVVGSRWMKGGGVAGYDPIKYCLNRVFQILFKVIFFTRIHDLTLGFKLVKRKIIDDLRFRSNFHDIAIETTIMPIKHGYRVEEVPVVWRSRNKGVSKNKMSANLRYLVRALSVRVH